LTLSFSYPAWYLVLAPILGFALAWIYYRKNETLKSFSKIIFGVSFLLRGLALTLIFWLLAEPLLKTTENFEEKPLLVVALDNSLSVVSTADSSNVRAFYESSLPDYLGKNYPEIAKEILYFDSETHKELDFKGNETNPEQFFAYLKNTYGKRDNLVLVMASDGIFNKGANPLYLQSLKNQPVYTIGLGDTTQYPDLYIANARYNRLVYKGNEFPIEVQVGKQNVAETQTMLSLYLGNEKIASQPLNFGKSDFVKHTFYVKAESEGLIQYKVRVEPFSNELNIENNQENLFIEVIENRQKILVFNAEPHPDIFAIVSALKQIESFEVIQKTKHITKDDLAGVDLIITHGVPSKGSPGVRNVLKSTEVPMFNILGTYTDLLAYNQMQDFVNFEISGNQKEDYNMVLNSNFNLFNINEKSKQLINNAPPISFYFNKPKLKKELEVLATRRIGTVSTQLPVWVVGEDSGKKYAAIFGEGIWRWRMADFRANGSAENFDKLIGQMATFLVTKKDKSQLKINHKKEFSITEKVVLNAELYNRTFEPFENGNIKIEIKGPEGFESVNYFSDLNAGLYKLETDLSKPGAYNYTISVDEFADVTYSGSFQLRSYSIEKNNLTANHKLLKQIAKQTNADFELLSNYEKLLEKALNDKKLKPTIFERIKSVTALSLVWVLILILGLLATEWLLRKYAGNY
jgi:hypothetical protein